MQTQKTSGVSTATARTGKAFKAAKTKGAFGTGPRRSTATNLALLEALALYARSTGIPKPAKTLNQRQRRKKARQNPNVSKYKRRKSC